MGTPTTPHLQPLRCILPPPTPLVKGRRRGLKRRRWGLGRSRGHDRSRASRGRRVVARWPVSRVLSPLRRDGHPSRPSIARRLQRSTRRSQRCAGPRRKRRRHPPIRPCSRQSLPRFTPPRAEARGGLVSVALVRALRRTGVTRCLHTVEPGLSSSAPEDADAAVRPSRRTRSLARGDLDDESVERRRDTGREPRCQLGEVEIVVEMRE